MFNKRKKQQLEAQAAAYYNLTKDIKLNDNEIIIPESYRLLTQDAIINIARAKKVMKLEDYSNGLTLYICEGRSFGMFNDEPKINKNEYKELTIAELNEYSKKLAKEVGCSCRNRVASDEAAKELHIDLGSISSVLVSDLEELARYRKAEKDAIDKEDLPF